MKISELSIVHEDAFLQMVADYQAKDPAGYDALYKRVGGWSAGEFKKFLKDSEKSRLDWRPGPNRVSLTRYVLAGNDRQILANGRLRFPLDAKTEIDGGNLEVDVPPSWRGQGIGSYCLSMMLFEAVRAGLRRALVTCLASDPAACRVIEKNRGKLQDTVESTAPGRRGEEIARYWIDFRG